jgi:hypothetical protein
MKTKAEKLKLAAQLLDQDKSFRVIAKRTHLSLNDISALKKQKFGDEKSQTSVAADNKYTEAYKLFEIKSPLIDVAIKLGLEEKTTRRYWAEYRRLKKDDKLSDIYDEVGPNLDSFLELYRLMREHELTPKDVEYVAEKLLNIQELEQSETNLKNRVEQLCSQRMKLRFDLDGMQQRWGMLEKYCDQLKDEIDLLEFRIRKLNKERMAVEEEKEDYKE